MWDAARDVGHQLLGVVEAVQDVGVMDGYLAAEETHPSPQVASELRIRIEKIMAFSRAPHSDSAEGVGE